MTEVLAASRIPLENYAEVVGAGEIEELRALAKPLRGRSIEMINSTAVGGGVAEIMVIHAPQPAARIEGRPPGTNHWVWRCHIDLSHPNPAVWDFLEKFVTRYDAAMFSSPEFSRQLSIPQYLFYPAIDPLSEK